MVTNITDHSKLNYKIAVPAHPDYNIDLSPKTELNSRVESLLQTDLNQTNPDPIETDINIKLVDYVLDNTVRKEDGRLQMPLMWNPTIKHHLSRNMKIAYSMLASAHKKLSAMENGLVEVNKVFLEQEQEGIIERIPNIDNYLETHPNAAFLAHMPVVRTDSKSTKVRMVFLPTQSEKTGDSGLPAFSNNQCILPGPNLNRKITTAVHNLRFGKYLLTYDLRKAFLNIELPESDKDKLLFLWFRNVDKGDFTPIAFRNARLAFGLKCSPSILMIALFKILVIDAENDSEDEKKFKRLLYHFLYVDNGAIASSTERELEIAKSKCEAVFSPYKFTLQQFVTNIPSFQNELDQQEDEPTPETNKLLGVYWNRLTDKLGPRQIALDPEANTKRSVLGTLNAVYDVLGLYLPILNKAKLFMQKISLLKNLNWDDKLSSDLQREWRYVCSYVNHSGLIQISRNVGDRTDEFHLVGFTDASRMSYGMVVYLINVTLNKVHFLFAANHFNNASLKKKSIPELEMKGVAFGTSKLVETHKEFTGPLVVEPLNITKVFLYNDSLNTLQRIKTALYDFGKLKTPSAFVKNAIKLIGSNSEKLEINFGFVSGGINPADHMTRIVRYDKLSASNYLSGPEWLLNDTDDLRYRFVLPHPLADTSNSYLSDIPLGVGSSEDSTPVVDQQLVSRVAADCGDATGVKLSETNNFSSSFPPNYGQLDNSRLYREESKGENIDRNSQNFSLVPPPLNLDLDSTPLSFNESDREVENCGAVGVSGLNLGEANSKNFSNSKDLNVCNNLVSSTIQGCLANAENSQEAVISAATQHTQGGGDWKQSMTDLFSKFSQFRKPVSVIRYVLKFVNGFKRKFRHEHPNLLQNAVILPANENYYNQALKMVLKLEQQFHYPDVYDFLLDPSGPRKNIPSLVTKLNTVMSDELIRVKAKTRCSENEYGKLPILLPKLSNITKLLILKIHEESEHSGVYHILNELHKKYYLEHQFSVVDKHLKACVNCRRYHQRTIKLNQNTYRQFRASPSKIPFSTIFMDHLGPYKVYLDENRKNKSEVHILLVTCLWTRAINLKVCLSVNTSDFLRAFQSHVLDYGLPQYCLSDLGSSLVAGSNIITNFLNDYETHKYLTEQNVRVISFDQYPKGDSSLGSPVESCVKMIKFHHGKVFKKHVLTLENFRYLVSEAQHYTNKRPLCFKESLRDIRKSHNVDPITPEILLKGYSTNSLSIALLFFMEPEQWLPRGASEIQEAYFELNKSRELLRDIYHEEFLQSLIHQAVDRPNRYLPVAHRQLKVGDIVLLKEKLLKPLNYPMGIVTKTETNDIGETVSVHVRKGSTGEIVFRHSSVIILLIPNDDDTEVNNSVPQVDKLPVSSQISNNNSNSDTGSRPKRDAASKARNLIKQWASGDLI